VIAKSAFGQQAPETCPSGCPPPPSGDECCCAAGVECYYCPSGTCYSVCGYCTNEGVNATVTTVKRAGKTSAKPAQVQVIQPEKAPETCPSGCPPPPSGDECCCAAGVECYYCPSGTCYSVCGYCTNESLNGTEVKAVGKPPVKPAQVAIQPESPETCPSGCPPPPSGDECCCAAGVECYYCPSGTCYSVCGYCTNEAVNVTVTNVKAAGKPPLKPAQVQLLQPEKAPETCPSGCPPPPAGDECCCAAGVECYYCPSGTCYSVCGYCTNQSRTSAFTVRPAHRRRK